MTGQLFFYNFFVFYTNINSCLSVYSMFKIYEGVLPHQPCNAENIYILILLPKASALPWLGHWPGAIGRVFNIRHPDRGVHKFSNKGLRE